MMALGEEQCTRLFAMMHEDEIKDISSAMSQLGAVKSDVVERLCLDFVDNMGAAGNLIGSYESTERLLQKSLPRERASQIMEEIRGPAGRTMWDKLGNVHEAVLANYLKNEYPQTVAVVLSKVRPDHAARVLTLLPDSFAMEVVMRMLRMESVQKDVLDGVERTLRAEFMSNLARSTRRDAHEMMADIFNNLDRQSETRFIAALEERNREVGGTHQGADVHLRRPDPADAAGGAGTAARDREGQAAGRAEGRIGEAARHVLQEHVGPRRQDPEGRHGGARPGAAARCGRGAVQHRRRSPRSWRRRARSRSPKARTRRWSTRWTDSRSLAATLGTLFAEDFDMPDVAPEPEVIEPVFSAGELADGARSGVA